MANVFLMCVIQSCKKLAQDIFYLKYCNWAPAKFSDKIWKVCFCKFHHHVDQRLLVDHFFEPLKQIIISKVLTQRYFYASAFLRLRFLSKYCKQFLPMLPFSQNNKINFNYCEQFHFFNCKYIFRGIICFENRSVHFSILSFPDFIL